MSSVRALCDRVLWIDSGQIRADGTASNVIVDYLASLESCAETPLHERSDRHGNGKVRLKEITFLGSGTESNLTQGRPCRVRLLTTAVCPGASCGFTVFDPFGQPVTTFDSALPTAEFRRGASDCEFLCDIPELLLLPGRYRVDAGLAWRDELLDHVEAAAYIHVAPSELQQSIAIDLAGFGSVYLPHVWEVPGE